MMFFSNLTNQTCLICFFIAFKLIIMSNNNSGSSSTFYSLPTLLIIFLCLQTTSSQICISSSDSICLKCAPNYQLVNGTCLSDSPSTTILSKTSHQKLIYKVLPIVVAMGRSDAGSVNSSIDKQANKNTNQSEYEGLNQVESNMSVDASKTDTLAGLNNLTLGYLGSDGGLSEVKQRVDAENNLTAISQAVPAHLTEINVAIQPNLVQVKPKQQTSKTQVDTVAEPLLTQVKQRNITITNQQTTVSTGNSASTKTEESNSTKTSDSNNELELQLINQKLVKIGQTIQPNFVQVKITQPKQPSDLSNNSGIITLQQIGQQLTQVNQIPVQVQLKNNQNSSQFQSIQPVFTQTQNNGSSLPTNLVKLELIAQSQPPTLVQIQPSTSQSIPVDNFSWIKATRVELYNLTVVPQALTQVSLKPSSLSLNNTYTFKCLSNLTLFQQPSINSTGWQLSYAQYTHTLISKLSSQLNSHTPAEHSTLCFDPPFHQAYQHLSKKYKSLVTTSPIFAVYYQHCGFSKSFRIYFIDDSAFPSITVRECSIVVDLFRLMPAQVFLKTYERIVLTQ